MRTWLGFMSAKNGRWKTDRLENELSLFPSFRYPAAIKKYMYALHSFTQFIWMIEGILEAKKKCSCSSYALDDSWRRRKIKIPYTELCTCICINTIYFMFLRLKKIRVVTYIKWFRSHQASEDFHLDKTNSKIGWDGGWKVREVILGEKIGG